MSDTKPDMMAWLMPTLLAAVCWSASGLLPKLGEAPSNQKAALIAIGTGIYAAYSNSHLGLADFTSLTNQTLLAVIMAGVMSGLGMNYYQQGVAAGDVSTVTALSGLYPALTFLVAVVVFGEAANHIVALTSKHHSLYTQQNSGPKLDVGWRL